MCIIQFGPETPDPTQLDLFDRGTKETETVNNSTDSVDGTSTNEVLIRSPTPDPVYSIMGNNLNEAQQGFASSLCHKSRELVIKSRTIQKEEEEE